MDDDETSLVISNAVPRAPSSYVHVQNPAAHTPAGVAPRQNGDLTRSPSFVANSGSPEGSPKDRSSPLPPQEAVASPQESLIVPPTNPEVCSLTSSIYDSLPYDALPCEAQPLLLQRDGGVADDQISVFSHQSDYSQGHARPPSANAVSHSRQLRPNHVSAPAPVPELCSSDAFEDPVAPSDLAPSPPHLFATPSTGQESASPVPAPVVSDQASKLPKPSPSLESPTLAPQDTTPASPRDTAVPVPQAPPRQAKVPVAAHQSPVLTSAHLTPVPASSHHILASSHPSHIPASSHHTHAPAMPYHTHAPAIPHHCHVPTSSHLVSVSPPSHYTHVIAPPPYSPAPAPPTSYFASIPASHVPIPASHYSVSASVPHASVPLSVSSPVSIPPPPYQFAAPTPVSVAIPNPQQRAPAPWHHAPVVAQPPMPCPYHHAQKQQQQPGQDPSQSRTLHEPHARTKSQHDAWCGLSTTLPGEFARM